MAQFRAKPWAEPRALGLVEQRRSLLFPGCVGWIAGEYPIFALSRGAPHPLFGLTNFGRACRTDIFGQGSSLAASAPLKTALSADAIRAVASTPQILGQRFATEQDFTLVLRIVVSLTAVRNSPKLAAVGTQNSPKQAEA